jgi:hypothetical protein
MVIRDQNELLEIRNVFVNIRDLVFVITLSKIVHETSCDRL